MRSIPLLIVLLFVGATACNTTIRTKTRVITKYDPPSPAIHVDRFLYKIPSGPADILVVADNTVTVEPAIPGLKASYQQLLARFQKKEASAINHHIQVATTPLGRMPENFSGTDGNQGNQLSELFDPGGSIIALEEGFPIFTLNLGADPREPGFLTPLSSVGIGMTSPAFEERQHNPFFIVFLSGHDYPDEVTNDMLAQRSLQFRELIKQTHGFKQTHAFLVSRQLGTEEVYPQCHEFEESPRLERQLESLEWASLSKFDLCSNSWVEWPNKVWEKVYDHKTRLILTHPPFEPQTMVVRSAVHKFRYNQDFVFDPLTNEVRFLDTQGIEKGDLIEVSYFLEPPPEEFSGNPTPTPTPASRSIRQ